MIHPSWLPALFTLFLALPAQAAFTDNGDGTVSDTVTGLMWDKCSWGQSNNATCAAGAATTHTWTQALGVAVTANGASYKSRNDWRLPNLNELESLVKIDAYFPSIDTTAFPSTVSDYYWSSTNYAPDPANAWDVGFGDGSSNANGKTSSDYVRLVRSGQLFDSFDSQPDITAPSYSSASINAANTLITLTFDEALVNNLADNATLKAAITFAADGATFGALAAGDVVAISGSTVTVTFATALTGSNNKVKIDANSLKDAANNVVSSVTTTAAVASNDIAAPSYSSASINAANTLITLTFDEALVNNLADNATLKAAITFAADGATFGALAAGDVVAISGSTVTVTFATALTGSNNKVKIDANSLKDAANNVVSSLTTTAALLAIDTVPDAFSFTAQTGAALSSLATSNTITVAGINSASAISIVGGEYAVSTDNGVNWSAWSSTVPATVNLNDQVKVRQTASASYSTLTTATLTIGGVSGAFNVTTLAAPVVATSYTAAATTGNITASFTGGGAECGYTVSQFIPLTGHAASPPAGSAPAGVSFPHGLFDFTTGGCTAASTITMVITYPQALPSGTVYWKYGPTPGGGANSTPHWYQLPAVIAGNTATFSITDGGLGDDDLTANGTIVDQGGPGGGGAASIPTLSEWALLLLAGLVGLFGMGAMQRRKVSGL